ncbi:MAG: methyl-accepting chemotaxis protein [Ruminococcus sp.]|nr:methyl-accepting chemotaxis protein [Ruminococcus sp.]MCM1479555.1 methyl-accepting chemotaxis protein [Muribaculaceae bacterium]
MKSIERKIVVTTILLVAISMYLLGSVAVTAIYLSATNIVTDDMEEVVQVASDRAAWELQAYSNISAGLGGINELSDPDVPDETKKEILSTWAARYDLERCNLIDEQGNGIDGNTYSDREYYQMAMQGKAHISEPLVSKVTGKLTIIVAAPLYRDNIVVGCVYVVPHEEFLNNIVSNIKVSENSTAYMIDKNGNIIADRDMETVKSGESDAVKNDSGYSDVLKMREKMRNGETGFVTYKLEGVSTMAAYHSVDSTNGWSLAVCAPRDDFMSEAFTAIIITVAITFAAVAVAIVLSVRLGRRIGKPVKLCANRIEQLSEGDLTTHVPAVNTKDETGVLAAATGTMISELDDIITDIGRVLGEISNGNLKINCSSNSQFYVGDFNKILTFMEKIVNRLNDTIKNINTAADQVTMGAEQVSSAAQSLSLGTTQQASSVEQLASTIHEISEQVSQNSHNCVNASEFVNETAAYIEGANQEMERLTEAMNKISSTSDEIGEIIKAIEDIAFQTNILALNAAVEAARAGEAGKGFAVVADEVRNLASKSAEAAKDTTVLIEHSIDAVTKGMSIAAATASAMSNVGEKARSVEEIVSKIAVASEQQANMIGQINNGMEQISSVVQTNSATAEQSAAASEELNGQADLLKNLIGMFVLRDEHAAEE